MGIIKFRGLCFGLQGREGLKEKGGLDSVNDFFGPQGRKGRKAQ